MSFLRDSTLDHLREMVERPDLSGTRYRIEHELGRGGMGVVYQAWDSALERSVALKVIDGPPVEATTLAQLEHPGLVPVYDSGELPDGRGYYAMRPRAPFRRVPTQRALASGTAASLSKSL